MCADQISQPAIVAFLKKIPLFADLPDEDLESISQMAEAVHLPAGMELFPEGSYGDRAYIITAGQIEILKNSGGREVLLALRQSGDVIGEMSLLEASPRNASVRARTDSELLAISHEQLNGLLNTSPSAARAMLNTVTARWRSMELMLRQSEKLAQVGTLTAGIAHELNNPAAAAQRGAGQLRQAIQNLQAAQMRLNGQSFTAAQRELIQALESLAQERAAGTAGLDALERSDLEAEIESWLDDLQVEHPWEYAPALANLNLGIRELEPLASAFPNDQFEPALAWVTATATIHSLLEEIHQGAAQISDIVKSLKTYVYLDQAPVQAVDLHEGLDSTLVMLRSRMRGIILRRDYAEKIPRIQAYGSELNQVWTNLIANAIEALDGQGEIRIKTWQEGDWIKVEIQDDGPGISAENQAKIFSPFFTTKPVGKGTGLGLNLSYNIILKHGGDIKVFSRPGSTAFVATLPVDFSKAGAKMTPMSAIPRPDDVQLRRILEETHTIAVVGISDRPERPAFSVPAYLQAHGYRIIPVNPTLDQVLGEKAYPNLSAIPEPVDTVLIFRRSEHVPPVVDEAIQIGARVVWMQEGILHEGAAAAAEKAGLAVVMDTCMRAQHIRLLGKG